MYKFTPRRYETENLGYESCTFSSAEELRAHSMFKNWEDYYRIWIRGSCVRMVEDGESFEAGIFMGSVVELLED
ncbi:hypothetical protein M0R04_07440 [Candidatus Dojkabacteria bacterium]|jgi:hypothetical protein|nr:hypothetical protein [Candidatus Dojkabacteria bacterium]